MTAQNQTDYRVDGFQERRPEQAPLVQITDMKTQTTLYIDLQPLIEARLAESRALYETKGKVTP